MQSLPVRSGTGLSPWLSPASESSHPLRFGATQASTPDLDADCESGVAPDSPNLSNVKSARDMEQPKQRLPSRPFVKKGRVNESENGKQTVTQRPNRQAACTLEANMAQGCAGNVWDGTSCTLCMKRYNVRECMLSMKRRSCWS